ncbi:MAG: hypothetical protein FD149_2381 [Rhodospirillaceae bacterium]|nr:MAG: hypothetical protein FD149_2381 [Rhodospirillaceae bacterium]
MEASVKEVVGFYWNANDNSDDGTTPPTDDTGMATIDERFALSGLADDGGTTDIDERYVSASAPGASSMADDVGTIAFDESLYALAVPPSVSDHLTIFGKPAQELTWVGSVAAEVGDFEDILLALESFVANTPLSAVAGEFTIGGETSTYIWIDSDGDGKATTKKPGTDSVPGQPITIVTEADTGDLYIKLVGVDNINENANHHLFISG